MLFNNGIIQLAAELAQVSFGLFGIVFAKHGIQYMDVVLHIMTVDLCGVQFIQDRRIFFFLHIGLQNHQPFILPELIIMRYVFKIQINNGIEGEHQNIDEAEQGDIIRLVCDRLRIILQQKDYCQHQKRNKAKRPPATFQRLHNFKIRLAEHLDDENNDQDIAQGIEKGVNQIVFYNERWQKA
jgi:hypothetical protein